MTLSFGQAAETVACAPVDATENILGNLWITEKVFALTSRSGDYIEHVFDTQSETLAQNPLPLSGFTVGFR